MNYISTINAFWDAAALNPFSAGQVSLYFALLHVCNRNRWEEWFQAPNQVLTILTGLSRSGILKARKELRERGMIDFEEHGTKATAYKIMSDSTQDSVQKSTQVSKQDSMQVDATMSKSTQDSKQVSVQDSKQVSSTIAKSTQVSVQDGVQDSTQNSSTLYKHKQKHKTKTETKTERPPISPVERFEDFLSEYPKDSNRFLTEREYATLLLTEKVTEDDLVQSAKNYSEACRLEGKPEKYIKNAENFLRELVFDQYLPGKYKKPAPQKPVQKAKNKFVDFPQREYDYDKLEKMLLGGG